MCSICFQFHTKGVRTLTARPCPLYQCKPPLSPAFEVAKQMKLSAMPCADLYLLINAIRDGDRLLLLLLLGGFACFGALMTIDCILLIHVCT